MDRAEITQNLIVHYVDNYAEDKLDGTDFDLEIIEALSEIRNKYE